MKAVGYKCPSCSASLMFKPETGLWKCDYCAQEFTLEESEKNNSNNLKDESTIDVDEYTCSNCGAKIITDENTTATFCVYCGNTSIIKNRLNGMLKPKYIIPFKNTKQDAINAFLNFKKGKPFAPKEFGQKKQIDKLTGIYIPFWLYDAEANGEIDGVGLKIEEWYSENYTYKKTDEYSVRRAGTAKFERIPVDGAIKFDDDIMDSIEPFDYNEMRDFSVGFLSGFLAEKYDIDSNEAYKRALARIENSMEEYFKRDMSVYASVKTNNRITNANILKSEYVLFPVWLLNIRYKNKMHTFAMNGQTGKMIGDVPISVSKLLTVWLGIILGIAVFFIGGALILDFLIKGVN